MSDGTDRSNESVADALLFCGGEKPLANDEQMLQIIRAMTPQQKLAQVFKLNERTLKLMRIGLRQRHPDLDDESFEKLYLETRMLCHNQNY